ncbi:Bdr family repetitive protein, partial [Borrelia sp. A-FGy1]
MSNVAREAKPRYEYVKQVFLDKDFPEDVIDY